MSESFLLLLYGAVEFAFYLCYKFVLVPRAQRRTEPAPYRDYGRDRHKLLERILDRIERTCEKDDFRRVVAAFLSSWFRKKNPPALQRLSSVSTASHEEDECLEDINGLCKDEVDEFFAWAFFGKDIAALVPWEQAELEKIYATIRDRCRLVFPPGRGNRFESRRLTLEDVNPHHRPLLVYLLVFLAEAIGNMLLWFIGFRRYTTNSGLVYWFRPGNRLPLLFFHGIAPAGKTFYLPLVLMGLGGSDRCTFFFEHASISCRLFCYNALTEEQTVRGVAEAVQRHVPDGTPVTLCGHSIGSCPITCLLRSSSLSIGQLVLLDPVTILLSEPDTVVNFVYSRIEQTTVDAPDRTKIQVVAGSELFTEHYLRRHFAWYNWELWMDDIPASVPTLICLSEHDEIISTPKVRQEVEAHGKGKNLSLIQWNGVGHAHCVTAPATWKAIRTRMQEQLLQ